MIEPLLKFLSYLKRDNNRILLTIILYRSRNTHAFKRDLKFQLDTFPVLNILTS